MHAERYSSAFPGSRDFDNVRALIESGDKRAKIYAICRMSDQNIIMGIALIEQDPDLRGAAVLKITNQSLLKNIAIKDPSWEVRSDAIEAIRDPGFILSVSENDEHPFVRGAAKERADILLRTD